MFAVFQEMKAVRLFLAVLLFFEGTAVAFAKSEDATSSIDNVHFEVAGDIVRLNYDLNAPIDRVHAVRAVLYRESDPGFSYHPVNLTGDVGTIVFPGAKRRIIWEFTKEFPEGLIGNDYFFVVEAEWIEPETSYTWWYVGGGAAAVVGLVTVLLLSGKTDGPGPTPVSPAFPGPPARPTP
jgi:hypothetical protein